MKVNSVQFTQNYTPNNSVKMSKTPNFTGALGDKFVRDITLMADVDANKIMKELKGTFGLKSEKVQDVLESFIDSLRKMTLKGKQLEGELRKANEEIARFPAEKEDAVLKTEQKLRKSFVSVIDEKNQEIAAAKAETKEAQKALEKYKPVANVKSVEEMATIMPEKAIEIMKEMAEHKATANKSMLDFLMTGKGQEEALKQIERNNMILKARQDGIFDIPSVKSETDKISKENGIYAGSWAQNFTIELIEKALKSSPQGEYIASNVVKEQVYQNAMAILTPMANERYSNTGIKAIQQNLKDRLSDVVKFHENFKNGLAKLEKQNKNYKDYELIINKVENDVDKSKVTIKYTDTHYGAQQYDLTFNQVAYQGSSY